MIMSSNNATLPGFAPSNRWRKISTFFYFMLAIFTLYGCSLPFTPDTFEQQPPPIEKAQVVFGAVNRVNLKEGEKIELVILDEVTGLSFNQQRLEMELYDEPQSQYVTVFKAPIGTVIPFRFEKINQDGSAVPEVGVDGNPVRYRLYRVDGPAVLHDTIAGWADELPNPDVFGFITGQVVSDEMGEPIKDILVTAGGVQAVTDSEGKFTLSPLIPGRHTLIAYSMNGSYIPAHIEAGIADNNVTNATLHMRPTSWKEVTFNVQVPENTFAGAPIRLAGNLAQLGNTFIELGGGMSGDPKQMPVLTKTDSGLFTLKMTLPAGIDIRYKYTLGDGFWNAEHGLNKEFILHQLIIPNTVDQLTINDQVATWKSSDTETIWFQVFVPEETPDDEQIGIQFSVAGWMPALPMFKIKENQWAYPLISPHNFSSQIPYRFCRNTPCTGNSQMGVESLAVPRSTETRFSEQVVINDKVDKWAFLSQEPLMPPPPTSKPEKRDGFIAGLSLTPYYSPTWVPYIGTFMERSQSEYNQIMLSPAWYASSPNPPTLFNISINGTPNWNDLISEIESAHNNNLSVSLFPTVNFSTNPLNWWAALRTDDQNTWELWLTQYQDFLYQYATLAELTETETFVLGGDWITPALPTGDNAELYHQPGNIYQLWKEIIARIREKYHGEIAWYLPLDVAAQPPEFISEVDTIYLEWTLAPDPAQPVEDLKSFIGSNLDSTVKPLKDNFNKPVVLLLVYPSLQGYGSECIPSPVDEGSCIDVSNLFYGPVGENPAAADIQGQADYYAAFLSAVSERDWIDGVISQGYSPTLKLHDSSASIHGKPAEQILLDWFSSVLGN